MLDRGLNLYSLPGTEIEVDTISKILSDHNFQVNLIKGDDAKEQYVKNIQEC